MAKRKSYKRRRSVGSLSGKIQNRSFSIKLMDLLWVAAGAVGNYVALNPLMNMLTEKLTNADGTPMLGEYQTQILAAVKTGSTAYLAYALKKVPKEVRLALAGMSIGGGVELAGQFIPADKFVALNGTGDLFVSGIGAQKMLSIPNNTMHGLGQDVSVYGTGDLGNLDYPATYGTGDLMGAGDPMMNNYGF